MRNQIGEIAALAMSFASIGGYAAHCEAAAPESAIATPSAEIGWVELGTASGPIPTPDESQPSHLLLWQGAPVLIDVGDGAAGQLAKVGVSPSEIEAIFISHLHFDHTGGLFAFMGLRYQGNPGTSRPLSIYGPAGTRRMIDGLLSAMQSGSALLPTSPPIVQVVELADTSVVDLYGLTVTAAENSHYQLWDSEGDRPVSLSYRFDLPDWSVVYTGDTGPSETVERLARDTDLLVSEIMDADVTIAMLEQQRGALPDEMRTFIHSHFTRQHLSPEEAGKLAERAGAKALVLTHFGGNLGQPSQITALTERIANEYRGSITFAKDLQKFGKVEQ